MTRTHDQQEVVEREGKVHSVANVLHPSAGHCISQYNVSLHSRYGNMVLSYHTINHLRVILHHDIEYIFFIFIYSDRKKVKSINANKHKPGSNHFNSSNHSLEDLTITGIDASQKLSDHNSSLKKETFWISQLRCLEPLGLNIDE